MTYEIRLTREAEADIRRLDPVIARRVISKLQWLADNVETVRHEALGAAWQGVFKLRVGDYRALYTLDVPRQQIIVHFARNRREVYKL